MKALRVAQEVYDLLMRQAIFQRDDSGAQAHGDGTVTFPVDDDVAEELARLDPDPNLAIRLLLEKRRPA